MFESERFNVWKETAGVEARGDLGSAAVLSSMYGIAAGRNNS